MKITKNNVDDLILKLKNTYPEAKCSLDFTTPFEIIIAVMLSAQCTDERVNKTTPNLFNKYNTPEALSKIDIKELEKIIHPCGFFKTKAKNIILCSKQLLLNFDGNVPNNIDDLITLAGIGRKSANVVMLEAFNNPVGIAVDTHVKRISTKLGLTNNTIPEKIEQDLLKIFSKKHYLDVNHLLVWHGRNICIARKPKCNICPISEYCKSFNS